jgi:hypothetical protein
MSSALRERGRYRRATDLYVTGQELVLKSGDVIWLQAMNSLERDEAVSDAQAARSRLALSLKDEDSEEQLKIRVMFVADGEEGAIARLREAHRNEAYVQAVDEIEAEEDWVERVAMIRRGPDLMAVATPEEQAYYKKTLWDFTDRVGHTMEEILTAEEVRIADLDEKGRWEEYLAWWSDIRGNDVGIVEYRYTELYYAARACIAEPPADGGKWDHSQCEQHTVRIYDAKEDLRHEPENYLEPLFTALAEMEVSDHQAKLLAAQSSSSDLSASQSSAVESVPSIPTETPAALPGT